MKVMIQKRATPFITLMNFCYAATLDATGQGGAADI